MTLNRDITKIFNWIFDNLIPPYFRDRKWFMLLAFYPLFGKKSKLFMEFKEKAASLSEEEFSNFYQVLSDVHIQRETDLNKKSIEFIKENITGEKILDIASGRGYLVNTIAKDFPDKKVSGIDIIIPNSPNKPKNANFEIGNIEKINYPDKYFDTTICAHTLEHVQHITQAIAELRRVTKTKLIIVVPRQREYKFTFDLHLHFFPYLFSFQKLMNNNSALYQIIDNDIVFMEIKNK